MACRLMKEFSWTIEYTLSLTYPVFLALYELVRRVRADSAIDEFFHPYLAAKWGKEGQQSLFSLRGGLFLEDTPEVSPAAYRPEDLTRAKRRLSRILKRRRKELTQMAKN